MKWSNEYVFELEAKDKPCVTSHLPNHRSITFAAISWNHDLPTPMQGRAGTGFAIQLLPDHAPALVESLSKLIPSMNRAQFDSLRLDLYKLIHEMAEIEPPQDPPSPTIPGDPNLVMVPRNLVTRNE